MAAGRTRRGSGDGGTLAGARANGAPTQLNEKTVVELQAMMAAGQLTSVQLTQYYVDRILALDQNGPASIRSSSSTRMRWRARGTPTLSAARQVLGPLHGIPVLLKDNIDMATRCRPPRVVRARRKAGRPRLDRRRKAPAEARSSSERRT